MLVEAVAPEIGHMLFGTVLMQAQQWERVLMAW